MSEMLQNFLTPRLPITGVAAYSIQLPDRVLDAQCLSKSLYPSTTEQMLNTLAQASKALLPGGGKPVRYSWVFECLRVHVALRTDGACLVLLVENNASAQMNRIQDALRDFIELTEPT